MGGSDVFSLESPDREDKKDDDPGKEDTNEKTRWSTRRVLVSYQEALLD